MSLQDLLQQIDETIVPNLTALRTEHPGHVDALSRALEKCRTATDSGVQIELLKKALDRPVQAFGDAWDLYIRNRPVRAAAAGPPGSAKTPALLPGNRMPDPTLTKLIEVFRGNSNPATGPEGQPEKRPEAMK